MLTGACISRAGFNRATTYSTAVWVLASELPDIDIVYYLSGGGVEYFAHHRGWTHTFIAAPLNAALVVGGVYLYSRWRKPPAVDPGHIPIPRQQPRWGLLFLFGILASFGHILLDYVTAYGVRPFEPFNFTWYSYDIVSIIEPLWMAAMALALVLPFFFGLVSEEVGEHKHGPKGRGWAIAALIFMLALWGYRDYQHRRALSALNSVLYHGSTAGRASAYPYMVNPYTWHGVVDTRDFYQTAQVNSRTGETDDTESGHTYYKPEETPITIAAKRTRLGQVYLDWAVYPMIETLPEPDGGWEVRFYDLRYAFPGRSSTVLGAYVLLDKDLHVVEQRMGRRDSQK